MDTDRYQQIKRVFAEACLRPPDEQTAYLDQACAGDDELRSEVEALLAHDTAGDSALGHVPNAAGALGLANPTSSESPAPLSVFSAPDRLPERIGRYHIRSLIGAGGMGAVYEAEQDHPRRLVALKVIRPGVASEQMLRRFALEADVLGRLQHPGIAHIHEAGAAEVTMPSGLTVHQPYFAMERVEGTPLGVYAAERALSVRARLQLLATICDAVHHAHQKGVIHRDLKPGNILVTADGQPKVLDFGVARAIDGDIQAVTIQTDAGQLVGTIPYMSPEQVAGDSSALDTRSDVYALGVIGFELLTSRLPIDVRGKSIPEATRAIRDDDPTTLSALNRPLRGDLETIFAKALEKDRERRYASAAELASDLRRYLDHQPIAARPATPLYQMRKFAQRNRALVAAAAIVAATLLIATPVSLWQAARAMSAERLAQQRADDLEQANALAEQRRERAERESRRANEVRDFLTRMLDHVDPYVVGGRDVSLLREILEESADEIDTEFADFPETRAELDAIIGRVFLDISEHDRAEPHLQRAYETRKRLLGPDHPDTLDVLGLLAQLRSDQGRLDEAEAMYREYVDGITAAYGPYDERTLEARYSAIGLLKARGDYLDAEQQLEALIETVKDKLGPDHSLALWATNGLAMIYQETGRAEEAEPLLHKLVETFTRTKGADHPRTMMTIATHAVVLQELGRLKEAETLLTGLLDSERRIFGEDHQRAIRVMVNLTDNLRVQGQLERAEALARDAVERADRALGRHNPVTFHAHLQLGIILRERDRLDECEPHLRLAVELARQQYGPESPDTLSASNSYAGLLYDLGRYDEAVELMTSVATGRAHLHGEGSREALTSRANLGLALMEMGRLEQAERELAAVSEIAQRALPEKHWFRLMAQSFHGVCLFRLQRFEEAETNLLASYQGLRDTLGEQHPKTIEVRNNTAQMYEAWGKPELAEQYRTTEEPE